MSATRGRQRTTRAVHDISARRHAACDRTAAARIPARVDEGGTGSFHERMRSLHRLFCLCLALPAGLNCGFPDATFTERSSTGVGGASGTADSASSAAASSGAAGPGGGAEASSAGGNGGGPTGTGGDAPGSGGGAAGSGGGSATSSASTGGGSAGAGGSATSSASASAATSGAGGGSTTSSASAGPATSSSSGGTVDCDADKDGYLSIACEGGDDCNDDNPSVHPNQPSTFYDSPIPPGRSFDYDCSGKEEMEFASVKCTGLLVCAAANNVFLSDVPCGSRGPFGSCDLTCKSIITFPNYVRECH
ncbi:hypothetical protein sce5640 [Sorangium cellulosum So ce56]|uniref:Uncharacterized protein n=2 Tax=Sorangium cellulosum TaxID=56 RepID=A9G3V8_SORC5|nr:hypothetical protein sce5640 [Sorangium cellulosum So ce56]